MKRSIASLVAGALSLGLVSSALAAGGGSHPQIARKSKPNRLAPPAERGLEPFRDGSTDAVPGEAVVQLRGRTSVSEVVEASLSRAVYRGTSSLGNNTHLIKVAGSEAEAIARLDRHPAVAFAEPNYVYSLQSITPDDVDFSLLWGLHNTGQVVNGAPGIADADIDAPEAWEITTGSEDVVVAVVDTGVAADHPDLADNMVPGYDSVEKDGDPDDLHGHGTHVAGTIAARGNNALGSTGVSWTSKIMPIRVLGENGSGTNAQITRGINWAVDHGADVVNMSLGGPGSSKAMAKAIANGSDTLFVVAAGNEASNNEKSPSFPCNYTSSNLICVAATDQSDHLASFSNYGKKSVDIAAPGTSIYSAQPRSNEMFSDGFEDGGLQWLTGGTTPWGLEEDYYGLLASDSPYTKYRNNTDSWIDSLETLDLTGRSGCTISYWLQLDTQLDKDGMIVQASTDGQEWTTVDGWTGFTDGFLPFTADMSQFDGESNVTISFRMISDKKKRRDGALIDDVSVGCLTGATYDASSYTFLDGTSMATPHVAGAAALVLSHSPSLSPEQVAQALIEGGDDLSGLGSKLKYPTRLNAHGALQAAR